MVWRAKIVVCIIGGAVNCISGNSEDTFISKELCKEWALSTIDTYREEQFPRLIVSTHKCEDESIKKKAQQRADMRA